MPDRNKFLFIILAVILIPILLLMTPLNFVQKIGAGCPFSKGKQALICNPCPFNSIISQEDHGITDLPSMIFNGASLDSLSFKVLNSKSSTSNSLLSLVPLRC